MKKGGGEKGGVEEREEKAAALYCWYNKRQRQEWVWERDHGDLGTQGTKWLEMPTC